MKVRAVASTLLLLAAGPAAADWIVPRTGEPIETVGAWEHRGKAVVFRQADGGLYLLPSSEIDWPRTRWENLHPARQAVVRFVRAHGLEISDPQTLDYVVGALLGRHRARDTVTAAARTEPRYVLTDADVAHVVRKVPLPARQFPVEWRRSFDSERPGELVIAGTVTNASESTVRALTIELRFLGEDGRVQEEQKVEAEPAVVGPGERAGFRCLPRRGGFREIEVAAEGRLGPVD